MDNIIYRSWDKETEEFIFSDQDSDEAWFEFNGGTLKAYAIHSMDAGSLDEPPQPNVVELERPELFTTIKDIKNMMIFQGDKVKYPKGILGDDPGGPPRDLRVAIIEWDEDNAKFTAKRPGFAMDLSMMWVSDYCEIIGHIHKGGEMKEGG